MRIEPATLLVVILGSVSFFLLILPLAVVLVRLRAVWQADLGTGLVLGGVILLTGLFFGLYFLALGIIAFSGG